MTLRDAKPADLPAIVDIYNSTIPGRMVTADTEPVSVESRLKWFHDHTPNRRPLLVVEEENGSVIGWISLRDFYGRPAYQCTAEVSIYLNPAVRGKGLGKYLLDTMLKQAPSYGVFNLLGFIFAHNESSLQLFRKAGFEEWGNLKEVAILDDIPRSLIIMGKKIV
ncbi:GNAT family N-acetyltransferase [Rhodocytophaga aerolata]|uniref:GNAT family N-acetyltransferase n=1 Tax=Rhodocytophaga aerolata TaxID=455078 RepID=A0ABT8R5X0_9BACT|nr:GNAT family N-acetyltransferase [Rhodocytophaga aerolata]MDO1446608.1 GNAT family N-acetyltransferase [Rhodocytophaga aerolata]